MVDDDSIDVTTIRRALDKADHPFILIAVSNGEEALTVLRSGKIQHPLIILLDLHMPKMDGFTFLKELRQDAKLKTYIVFVLTGSSTDMKKVTTYHEGIAGYLSKDGLGSQYEQLIAFLAAYSKVVYFPHYSE